MKIESIQILRAAACLSVMVYHLMGLSNDYASGVLWFPTAAVLKAGLEVFFVVSGVVMVITTFDQFGRPGSARRFAIHRLSRIYPPYWILTGVLTLYWLSNPGAINSKSGGVDLLASWTLAPAPQLPLVPVAWTLSYELMFYVVFFMLMVFVRRSALPAALLVWAAAVVAYGLTPPMARPQAYHFDFLFSPFVLAFICGCLTGLAFRTGRLRNPLVWLGLAALWIAGDLVWIAATDAPDNEPIWVRTALYLAPSAALAHGVLGLEANKRWVSAPRWLVACGDASYSIYLVHILILHAAYRFLYADVFKGFGWAFPPFCAIASVGAGWLYYRYFERPSSALAKKWLERATARATGDNATPFPQKSGEPEACTPMTDRSSP